MKFKPTNRHLLIEPVEEKNENETTSILLPEDYKIKNNFGVYKILDVAENCNLKWEKDSKIIVTESTVQEVKVNNQILYLTVENYVLGVLGK